MSFIKFFKTYCAGVLSFLIFGSLTIFWSLLHQVDCPIILFHRALWTFLFALPINVMNRNYKLIIPIIKKKWFYLFLSSLMISINWYTFVYAVNANYIFEAGLAYYISPIITVFLSFLLLKEKLTQRQCLAIVLASSAILYLIISKNIVPKYALVIGLSFSLYGILGRKIQTPPILRIMLETFSMTLLFLFLFKNPKELHIIFLHFDFQTKILCILSGLLTLIPMFLYILATKQMPLTTLGVLNFLLPTVVFFISIFYFHEPIDREKFITILWIWVGIALYISELFRIKKNIPIRRV